LRHFSAILVKFAMTTIVLEIVLYAFSGLSFWSILGLSLVVTLISYLIGDLVILPATNNLTATIADIILVLVTIYIANFLWYTKELSFFSALIAAVVLGAGEWFFHKLIDRKTNDEDSDIWSE